MMPSSTGNEDRAGLRSTVDAIVQEYHQRGDVAHLLAQLASLAVASSTGELTAAAERYREMHEVAGPLYEVVVEREPGNARALVALANAYWLTGRGPDVVGDLASRAIAADPSNRAAWHLWALTEPSPRGRVQRWQQVAARFADDQLARANLADNAAALAGAEDDPVALKLAIATYESLLSAASHPEQVVAVQKALSALRGTSV